MGFLHQLKTYPEYFKKVTDGSKKFEIRKNDRNYRVGDTLELCEYVPDHGYTGRRIKVNVTYILHGGQFGIEEDVVVMSIYSVQQLDVSTRDSFNDKIQIEFEPFGMP